MHEYFRVRIPYTCFDTVHVVSTRASTTGLALLLPLPSVAFSPCNFLGKETRSSISGPPTDQGLTCRSAPMCLGSENLEARPKPGQASQSHRSSWESCVPPGSTWGRLPSVLPLSRVTVTLVQLGFLRQSWERSSRIAGSLPYEPGFQALG